MSVIIPARDIHYDFHTFQYCCNGKKQDSLNCELRWIWGDYSQGMSVFRVNKRHWHRDIERLLGEFTFCCFVNYCERPLLHLQFKINFVYIRYWTVIRQDTVTCSSTELDDSQNNVLLLMCYEVIIFGCFITVHFEKWTSAVIRWSWLSIITS